MYSSNDLLPMSLCVLHMYCSKFSASQKIVIQLFVFAQFFFRIRNRIVFFIFRGIFNTYI